MRFGYIPLERDDKSRLWNIIYRLVYRVFGRPEYLRVLQAPLIFELLDIQKKDRVVDLACGKAHFAYEAAKTAKSVIATDIKLFRERIPEDKMPNLQLIEADARKLPVEDESIDKVLMSSFLQMIPEDELVLQQCHRILKPDGILVLSVPTDYLYIPKLYHSGWIRRKIRSIFRLPAEYSSFLSDLNRFFEVTGKGYYSLSALVDLINGQGFVIERYEYCPRKTGSFIFEIFLLLMYRMPRKSRFFWALMFLFRPLGLIDRLLPKETKGCEIILKARKSVN